MCIFRFRLSNMTDDLSKRYTYEGIGIKWKYTKRYYGQNVNKIRYKPRKSLTTYGHMDVLV